MKYLGIDYGTKRVGLAVSDPDGKIAFPLTVLPNNISLMSEIKKICEENKVEAVILGQSLNYKGIPNPVQGEIAKFLNTQLLKLNLPIHYQNEVLTSALAGRTTSKARLDSAAAALILQAYLDHLARE
jgi:putative holliday junction resolvase